MKNPWKRLSKINPQRKDGNRQINTHVFNALVKAKLPTAEMSVVLTIISKTWGFNKKSDVISTSQFSKATGFPLRTIKRARQRLFKKRIIFFNASKKVFRGSPLNEYMFNKHYDTWKIQDKKKCDTGDTPKKGDIRGKKRVSPKPPTIETITIKKENNIKERLGQYEKNMPIPKNYSIQPEHYKYVLSKNLTEQIAKDEFEPFVTHHTAKGSKFKDWYAAYQRWIQNGIKFKYLVPQQQIKIVSMEEALS